MIASAFVSRHAKFCPFVLGVRRPAQRSGVRASFVPTLAVVDTFHFTAGLSIKPSFRSSHSSSGRVFFFVFFFRVCVCLSACCGVGWAGLRQGRPVGEGRGAAGKDGREGRSQAQSLRLQPRHVRLRTVRAFFFFFLYFFPSSRTAQQTGRLFRLRRAYDPPCLIFSTPTGTTQRFFVYVAPALWLMTEKLFGGVCLVFFLRVLVKSVRPSRVIQGRYERGRMRGHRFMLLRRRHAGCVGAPEFRQPRFFCPRGASLSRFFFLFSQKSGRVRLTCSSLSKRTGPLGPTRTFSRVFSPSSPSTQTVSSIIMMTYDTCVCCVCVYSDPSGTRC